MTYEVKYKRRGQWFYRTINKVKGDGLIFDNGGVAYMRFFVTEDEVRYEVPTDAVFIFSKGRFFSILENTKKESGQDLNPETKARRK